MKLLFMVNDFNVILMCPCYNVIIHLSDINELHVLRVALGFGLGWFGLVACNCA